MEHDRFETVNQYIREAAKQAAATGGLAVPTIERFLRTSEEAWDGAGSGQFTTAQFQNNEAYLRAAKIAMRTLFHLLANLLQSEAQLVPVVAPYWIRQRIDPMVRGLVQGDWRELALRELGQRTFVLNFQGAKAAMDVELPPVTPRRRGPRQRRASAPSASAYSVR